MLDRQKDDPRFISSELMSGAREISVIEWRRYRGEFDQFFRHAVSPDDLALDQNWIDTLTAVETIHSRAQRDGARMILLGFRARPEIYYERAYGRSLPETSPGDVQSQALQRFAERLGIPFLDAAEAFKQCVAAIKGDAPQSKFPYLLEDGHYSALGNRWVAELVSQWIQSLELGQAPPRSVSCE